MNLPRTIAHLCKVTLFVRFSNVGTDQEQKKIYFVDAETAAQYSQDGVIPLDAETDPFVESAWHDAAIGEYFDLARTKEIKVVAEPF